MSQDVANADEILNEARILNSELGRHVRKCSFSTHLSGRFYVNHSLQSYNARAQRIAQMKAKRKELEKFLILEEKKIRFLEEELKKKIEERKRGNELKIIMDQAATIIQCAVRQKLAMSKVELMRIEEQIVNYLAIFLQARFHGIKARNYVRCIRQQLALERKEEMASIRIQSLQRCRIAKRLLAEKRQLLQAKRVKAACIIQARVRGILARKLFVSLQEHHAAIIVQCMIRMTMARKEVCKRKWALEQEKKKATPKRIPFYKKTYSIYSVNVSKRSECEISSTSLDSNEIVNSAPEQDSRAQRQPWRSQKRESSQSLDDKVILAQQRASMRAAKLRLLERVAKEKEEEQAALRKKELERLEAQRRAMMEEEHRKKLQSEKGVNVLKEQATNTCVSDVTKERVDHSQLRPSADKSCDIAKNKQKLVTQTDKHKVGSRSQYREPADNRKHHIPQGIEKIKMIDLSYCWDDGDFEEDIGEDENDLCSRS